MIVQFDESIVECSPMIDERLIMFLRIHTKKTVRMFKRMHLPPYARGNLLLADLNGSGVTLTPAYVGNHEDATRFSSRMRMNHLIYPL